MKNKNIIDIMMERDGVSMPYADYLVMTDSGHLSDFLYNYSVNHSMEDMIESYIELINALQPFYDKEYDKFNRYCSDYNIEPGIPFNVSKWSPNFMSYVIRSVEKDGVITDHNFKFKSKYTHYITQGSKLDTIKKEYSDYIKENFSDTDLTGKPLNDEEVYLQYLSCYYYDLLILIKACNKVGYLFYEYVKPIIH